MVAREWYFTRPLIFYAKEVGNYILSKTPEKFVQNDMLSALFEVKMQASSYSSEVSLESVV